MIDSRRPGSPRPPVRLRPAPPIDPPFTDEVADPWPVPSIDQLALDLFDPPRRTPARSTSSSPGSGPAPTGPGRRPRSASVATVVSAGPEATRVAHRFVGTCLEILNGYRPLGQIRPLSDPARATEVVAELTRAAARTGPVRRRSTRPAVRLRRLRVCEPRATVLEVAAVLSAGTGRSWAMALRLEHRRGRWLCTTIRLL